MYKQIRQNGVYKKPEKYTKSLSGNDFLVRIHNQDKLTGHSNQKHDDSQENDRWQLVIGRMVVKINNSFHISYQSQRLIVHQIVKAEGKEYRKQKTYNCKQPLSPFEWPEKSKANPNGNHEKDEERIE